MKTGRKPLEDEAKILKLLYNQFKHDEAARVYFGRQIQDFRVRHRIPIGQFAKYIEERHPQNIVLLEIGFKLPSPEQLVKIKRLIERCDSGRSEIIARELWEAMTGSKQSVRSRTGLRMQ